MPVKVRLTRVGNRNNPIWRVVVADDRSPRDGRFIEIIGHYNPLTEPPTVKIDVEKARRWLEKGAQPTEAAARLLRKAGVEVGQPRKPATGETLPTPEEIEVEEPAEEE